MSQSIANLGALIIAGIDRMGGMLRLCLATVARMPTGSHGPVISSPSASAATPRNKVSVIARSGLFSVQRIP